MPTRHIVLVVAMLLLAVFAPLLFCGGVMLWFRSLNPSRPAVAQEVRAKPKAAAVVEQKAQPVAPAYLDFEDLKVGEAGEFHPDETWRFLRFLDDTGEIAVLGKEQSRWTALCVPSAATQVESKPSPTDSRIKIIRLVGRWKVASKRTVLLGATFYSLTPDSPKR